MPSTATAPVTTVPDIDSAQDLIDDAEFYERKFRDNENKRFTHLFVSLHGAEDPQLAGWGTTLCGWTTRLGSRETRASVRCPKCQVAEFNIMIGL